MTRPIEYLAWRWRWLRASRFSRQYGWVSFSPEQKRRLLATRDQAPRRTEGAA